MNRIDIRSGMNTIVGAVAKALLGEAQPQPSSRHAAFLMPLEPRIMFDGAAAVDAAHALPDAAAKALIPDAPAPVEVCAADPVKDNGKKEVIFVDTSVANYKTLEAGIREGVGIVEIDGAQSGLAQMAKWAETHTGFDALHVLSHGAEATLRLGADAVTDASLSTAVVQAELAGIGHALKAGGDLLVYGCDVAKGAGGQQFVRDLATATGTDVAASDDVTGAAAKGGNWQLEYAAGSIETSSLGNVAYQGILLNATFDYEPGTGAISGGGSTTLQATNTAAGETLRTVAVAANLNQITLITGNPVAGTDSLGGSADAATPETSFTFSLTDGKQFDLTSITLAEWGAVAPDESLTFTSSKGTVAYTLVNGSTAAVFNVSGAAGATNMQGITSFTVTSADNTMMMAFDNIVLNNITAPGPTVTSATYDANTNSLVVTGTGMTATGGAANDIDVTKLTLTGQGGGTYQLTSTNVEITSATQFTVALNTADQAGVEGLLNKNGTSSVGATTYNIAAAADWNPANAGNADLTGNGVTVSNVQTPTITSATYDAATGVLAVTGANLVKTVGATNDITANTLTFTGEGGATYTLTDTANVETTGGSETTAFSLTLSATDKAAINQIVNKNGTASTGATTYNLAAADDWDSVIGNANIADATNAITASNVAVPAITSATYDANTGALVVTGSGFLKLNGTPNDIVANKLTFTGEGGATYTLTDSANVEITSGTAFTVTLSATDKAAINQLVNKNGTASTGATTYNLAAAEDWTAGAAAGITDADLAGNGITASNVAVPAITSATYDANTGALVVTGSGFLPLNGATNDIVANKLTLTGEGGATYTLTDTANVEITSATAFTLTLSATDKAAVNQLTNKNGTSSTSATTYNLAAADDWNAGADAGAAIADLAGNGITVSNVAVPTITSATYDYNTNVLVVTGTGFLPKTGATNDIDLTKLTFTGEGGATYTLTEATGVEITSGTQFSVTLSGADLTNVEALLNKDGTSAVSATTYNLAAAASWNRGDATNGSDASNAITVSNYAAPTVTSATFDAATNILTVTGTNLVSKSGVNNDVAIALLTLTGEGGSYALNSTDVEVTNATTFAVTLNAADQLVVRGLLNKNGTASSGATTYNLAAAEDWMAGTAAATNVADLTGNGITVSNVQTPTVTSATYDSDTGVLVVTGTNLFRQVGATNDIVVSKLTFTGQGGGGAAYTLTSATNVEITSATQFSVTLSGADKTNVDALLNQIGTSAADATTYNLAAAEDWLAGADAAANIADAVNAITVSVNPKITSATYDAATGALVVTGSNMQAKAGPTNDITAAKLTFTGEGGATYTLTDSADVELTSASAFTVTLSATDKATLNQIVNKNGTASTGATTYNLAGADDWNAQVTAGDTSDTTGNGITASNVAVPAITSATYDANTGALVVTGSGFSKLNGATNDIVANKLTFTGEGGATYTLTDSANVEITSGTAFTVTLSATDKAAINQIVNKNGTASTGATTYNLAAAEDWAAGADAAAVVADLAGNGITASNVAVPTITSATYDAGTGALVVTGSGFSKLNGATNDIVANKLTLTGEGGATYTLTDTANVEITSGTAFTVTLSATDKAAVNQLTNKNGTSSTSATTYNLAAAEDWAAGADAAAVVADLAGNGITVSNVAVPTITSATYDYATNVLVVTGTGFLPKSGATNDIDLTKLTFTGEGGATYTLTNATGVEITSGTQFSVTLSGADLTNVEALLNKDGTSAVSTATYNLAGAEDWNAGADAAAVIADLAGNAITVSNYAAPTVTSATFDAATNILTVTGTNLVSKSGGSNDVAIALLTLTGEGGSYALTSTDVEVTNATTFAVTLNAADQLVVRGLLNKNGTASSSATTYNLAAAEDWMAGTAAATNVADLAGNGITVSNVQTPTVTSATYDSDTGVLVVTGTNLFKKVGASNDIVHTKLTVTGQGGATHVLTDSTGVEITSATSFTTTLTGADKANTDALLNKLGTSANDATTYNLAAADDWLAGADAATNIADAVSAITVSVSPKLTSATFDAVTGALVVTGTNMQAKAGGANDITAAKLTFTGEGGATYTLTDSADVELTSASAFTVTLSATDKAALNQIVNKNGTASTGATTYNLAGADDWNAQVTAGDTSDTTGNGITASNVAAPAITSATYNAATGALVVTGSGFSKLNGATNDIVANKLTFTGEGGATYTLTDTANVEITSGTAFTVTLSATDQAAINQMVNKNGTASTGATTYNLAAAEDWAAGADAAVVVADLAGNGITASNVAVPTITSATYDAATGVLVVTGSGFVKLSGAANDIDVSKLSISGDSTPYTLTTGNVEITSGTAFTVTLSATDKAAISQIVNKNGTSSIGVTTYNLAAAEDWAAGAHAAVAVADLAGNGITAANVPVRAISFSATTFTEAGADNGSIATVSTITLANDTFTGANGGVLGAVSNVPAGLTAVLVKASATTATLTLTGNATNHANLNDIANLTVTFANGDFTGNSAAAVVGATTANLVVDFSDPAPPAPPAPPPPPPPPPAPPPSVPPPAPPAPPPVPVVPPPAPPAPPPPVNNAPVPAPVVVVPVNVPPPPPAAAPPAAPVPVKSFDPAPPPATSALPGVAAKPANAEAPAFTAPLPPPPPEFVAAVSPVPPVAPSASPPVTAPAAVLPASLPAANEPPAATPAPAFRGGSTGVVVLGNAAAPPGALPNLVVSTPIPDQSIPVGAAFSMALPAGTFQHTDANASVALEARQTNGAALPGWLAFDPNTGKFSGQPPEQFSGTLRIRVVARDSEGREAVTNFELKVDKEKGQRDGALRGDARYARLDAFDARQKPVKPAGRSSFSEQLAQHGRQAADVKRQAFLDRIDKRADLRPTV